MELLKKANGNLPKTPGQREFMVEEAAIHFGNFLNALGFDYEADPNSKDTPHRVAKAYVHELVKGCFEAEPKITAFDNVEKYTGMIFQGNIKLISLCSHHHLAFKGFAHVAYIPSANGKIIGLSKLNRIVDFYARRPQVQENLTMQIHSHIDRVCENNLGVAVMIEASHSCCSNRGIGHDSTMKTSFLSGAFKNSEEKARDEFYQFINELK